MAARDAPLCGGGCYALLQLALHAVATAQHALEESSSASVAGAHGETRRDENLAQLTH